MDEEISALQTLRVNTSDVTACDFGGNFLLAIGSSDKSVRVLEWKQGLGFVDMSYSPLTTHKYGVTWVRFSPQCTMLASSSVDGTTVLWNVRTGVKINTLVQSTRCSVRRCEFTPDSTKLITAGDDGIFGLWDLVHRTHIKNHCLHDTDDACVSGLAVSPDSEYLLTGDTSGLLQVTSISSSVQVLAFIKNVHEGVTCCDFSTSHTVTGGDVLSYKYTAATCGADGLVNLWSVIVQRGSAKGDEGSTVEECELVMLATLAGHSTDVHCVRFNVTGAWLASTGLDKTVRLWDVAAANCAHTMVGHTRYGNCLAFSRDSSLLVSGSNDKSLIVWDLSKGVTLDSDLVKPCIAASHFSSPQNNAARQMAEQLVMTRAEEDGNKMELLQTLHCAGTINSVQMHGENTMVVAGGDKVVSVWTRSTQDEKFTLDRVQEQHKYSINQVDISPCGSKIISSSMDGVIVYWDSQTGLTHEMRSDTCANSLRCCRFSPNGQLIAAAGDDELVFLWDATTLEFIKTLQQHKDAVTDLSFTPDNKLLASTSCGGDLKLHHLEGDECSAYVDDAHDLGAMTCHFSPDIISGSTSFDGDGEDWDYLLASAGNDSVIKLWRVQHGSSLSLWAELTGHGGNVTCVRFSPGLRYILVSAASDNTVRLWSAKTRLCLHVIEHHESMVTTCAFSQDSSLLATGSLDKTVAVWSLPGTLACDAVSAMLSYQGRKKLQNWTNNDIAEWLEEVGHADAAARVRFTSLSGRQLISTADRIILDTICPEEEEDERKSVGLQLFWLKKEAKRNSVGQQTDVVTPHHYLCPITHDIMIDPVTCSDGFTYERSAITEWLLSGRFTSPMTNEPLTDTRFISHVNLKANICQFLYGDQVQE